MWFFDCSCITSLHIVGVNNIDGFQFGGFNTDHQIQFLVKFSSYTVFSCASALYGSRSRRKCSFKIYSKWSVQANKQTNKHKHTCVQCSHASVGLSSAQLCDTFHSPLIVPQPTIGSCTGQHIIMTTCTVRENKTTK